MLKFKMFEVHLVFSLSAPAFYIERFNLSCEYLKLPMRAIDNVHPIIPLLTHQLNITIKDKLRELNNEI